MTTTTTITTISTTTTATTTAITIANTETSTEADYGDQIPLNFMDVNRNFALFILLALAAAAVVGTFGNLLILVAVATQRHIRSVESVFVVSLACCDLYVTMIAEPLSIVAKTVGWRIFEGVPGVCRTIGYLCTMSCVGSLMTLAIMSLNRYALICHHAAYCTIFTTRNSLLFCFFTYLFGFFLVSFNFYGIGDHGFDYKSFECVWDRMASHDYTIVFSIVLVWVPMFVTGLAYGKMYYYVRKVRHKVGRGTVSYSQSAISRFSEPSSVVTRATEKSEWTEEKGVSMLNVDQSCPERSKQRCSERSQPSILQQSGQSVKDKRASQGKPQTEKESGGICDAAGIGLHAVPHDNIRNKSSEFLEVPLTTKRSSHATAVRFLTHENPSVDDEGKTGGDGKVETGVGRGNYGLKLARPLFIIYVVFSTCWIPYSLVIIADHTNSFPHELHAFITAFAHLNSSINWLVYYHTHTKMRQTFRRLLGLTGTGRTVSIRPRVRVTPSS